MTTHTDDERDCSRRRVRQCYFPDRYGSNSDFPALQMLTTHASPRELMEIVVRSGRTGFSTFREFETALLAALGCERDYLRRILNGSRPLRPKHLAEISVLLGLEIDFSVSKRDLAVRLGLSGEEAGLFLDRPASGLDFISRTTDRKSIENLFALMKGYWECAYRSFSRTDQHAISRELFIVDGINQDNLITCRARDVMCTNTGVIFPVIGQLYIMYEKDKVFNEIVVYLTNRPDRSPPVLRGLVLGLSASEPSVSS